MVVGKSSGAREWNKKIKLMTKGQLKDLWKSQLCTIFHSDLLIHQQINDFIDFIFSHHNKNRLNETLKQNRVENCIVDQQFRKLHIKESNII